MRQTHSKEMESRDEEVEEARQSCQKKVRQRGLPCLIDVHTRFPIPCVKARAFLFPGFRHAFFHCLLDQEPLLLTLAGMCALRVCRETQALRD